MLNSLNSTDQYDEKRIGDQLEELTAKKQISYNKNQTKAIKAAIYSNFLVIIGGPGTGKTTVVDGIVNILKKFINNQKLS